MKNSFKRVLALCFSILLLFNLLPIIDMSSDGALGIVNEAEAANDFVVYAQSGQSWSSHDYSYKNNGKTISTSGCGVLSAVNAIYYLTGNFVDPCLVADYSKNNGCRVSAGTSFSLYDSTHFAAAYGGQYGFKYATCVSQTGGYANSTFMNTIKSHLQAGEVGIIGGGTGHVMVLAAYDTSKGFLLLDSAPSGTYGKARGTYNNITSGGGGYAWLTASEIASIGASGQLNFGTCYFWAATGTTQDWNVGGTVSTLTVNSAYPVPITAYPAATSGKITVYDNNLNAYSTSSRYISYSDLCTIEAVYTNGYCKVKYPSSAASSGYAEAYAKTSDFIPASSAVTPYSYSPSEKKTSYTRSNMSTVFGSVFTSDSCTVVGKSGELIQLIYPVSGGYKLGWISAASSTASVPTDSDFTTPIYGYNYSADTNTIVYQYESTLGGTKYGTIYPSDYCTINAVNLTKNWVNVTYPTSSGTKTGYVYLDQFFPSIAGISTVYSATVSQNTKVYRKADMATTIGTVYSTDTFKVVGKAGNLLEIIYPLDAGGYKLGWIYNTNITKTLSRIEITSNPNKTSYLEGEALDTSGLVVTAYYNDGSSANVTSSCTLSGYSNTVGSKTVTVSYSGKSTAFSVNVKSKSPTAISVTSKPTKTAYIAGEEFSTAGMVVKATYDNGTSQTVTDYSYYADGLEDGVLGKTGTISVTVVYIYNNTTVTTSFNISVGQYVISYNANGGTGAPGSQTKNYGTDLTLSNTVPTRTGYTFAGWNTKADGSGTRYAAGATYTANANITLYAQWTKESDIVESDYQLWLEGSTTRLGGQLAVPVYLDGVSLGSLTMTIQYDSTKLKYIEESDSAFEMVLVNDTTDGILKIVAINETKGSTGKLLVLNFEVIADAASETSISVSVTESTDEQENKVQLATKGADITISSLLLGDVNGDGEVTAIDARWVLQAAAGNRDLGKYWQAGDVNHDGEITALDARWILQAAAGKRTLK